jgi:hypothetical protein
MQSHILFYKAYERNEMDSQQGQRYRNAESGYYWRSNSVNIWEIVILVSAMLSEVNMCSTIYDSLIIDEPFGVCYEASLLDSLQIERDSVGCWI